MPDSIMYVLPSASIVALIHLAARVLSRVKIDLRVQIGGNMDS